MHIEAVPKYSNINFFELNGKPEKREDYAKSESLDKGADNDKSKDKQKSKVNSNELSL